MGKYLLRGVDRSSGKDVEFVVEADTSANARAKGDLKGTIVTEVIDWIPSHNHIPDLNTTTLF